ncbi:MAG: hypothetical protein ACD_5C00239G0006, partial [uncultured bacterium]
MRRILNVFIFIFSINFLWEISQMFLYQDHTDGFWDFIWVHIKASLGDVVIFLLIYALGVLILRDKKWFSGGNKYKYFIASLS